MTTDTLTAADVLERAADYLDEYGWCQEQYRIGHHVCAVGALRAVSGLPAYPAGILSGADELIPAALREACDALASWVGPFNTIAGWNDAPGTTKATVTAKLRELAGTMRGPAYDTDPTPNGIRRPAPATRGGAL